MDSFRNYLYRTADTGGLCITVLPTLSYPTAPFGGRFFLVCRS